MADTSLEKTDVFQFMVIRAPNSVEPKLSQQKYIKDEVIDHGREGTAATGVAAPVFSLGSEAHRGEPGESKEVAWWNLI
jgi:hypothetical protein